MAPTVYDVLIHLRAAWAVSHVGAHMVSPSLITLGEGRGELKCNTEIWGENLGKTHTSVMRGGGRDTRHDRWPRVTDYK